MTDDMGRLEKDGFTPEQIEPLLRVAGKDQARLLLAGARHAAHDVSVPTLFKNYERYSLEVDQDGVDYEKWGQFTQRFSSKINKNTIKSEDDFENRILREEVHSELGSLLADPTIDPSNTPAQPGLFVIDSFNGLERFFIYDPTTDADRNLFIVQSETRGKEGKSTLREHLIASPTRDILVMTLEQRGLSGIMVRE